MRIGIDASRAFLNNRTGIEEYSYQVIKHLAGKLDEHKVVLYVNPTNYENLRMYEKRKRFNLPKNWKIKIIRFPYMWTQAGLSLEMLFHPVDVLSVPSHVVPLIHSKKTIVTIHGLEYETFPEGYSFWERLYMRFSIKLSCRVAEKIIAVSKNTKKDLMELYKVPENKIEVVYEGVNPMRNYELNANLRTKYQILNTKHLLFIGRLEKRKNVEGIIKAYEILKEKYKIPHKLILAGKPGYGWDNIKLKISNSKYNSEILETGFISEEEKYDLLKNADAFLFPSFYEGFGLPVLEAQALGIPVVASNESSLPEVAGEGAIYCDPNEPITIADAAYTPIGDKAYRDDIIEKGYKNVERFSWDKCTGNIAGLLVKNSKLPAYRQAGK